MTETELELARELARDPAWTWQSGMMMLLDTGDAPIIYGRSSGTEERRDCIPDLSDAATIGCLIAMLGDDMIWISNSTTVYDKEGCRQVWSVTRGRALGPLRGRTLGEALARAWLAVNRGKSR